MRREARLISLKRLQFTIRLGKIAVCGRRLSAPADLGPLKLISHPIEMVGQFLDFICRFYVNTVAEIARLQLPGTDL